MKKRLVIVAPGDTVAKAARTMSDNELGAVLVVDNGKLTGIFSERDLLKRVVASGKDPTRTFVGEVATPHPVTVGATAQISDCYRIIKEKGFRHLPVVAADETPIGIISARDFLQFMAVCIEEHADMGDFFKNIGTMRLDPYGA
jgi:CBS domain-containing protein